MKKLLTLAILLIFVGCNKEELPQPEPIQPKTELQIIEGLKGMDQWDVREIYREANGKVSSQSNWKGTRLTYELISMYEVDGKVFVLKKEHVFQVVENKIDSCWINLK